MAEIIYKDEFYKIIGFCMEVHKTLGRGFLEIVYKDALEFEFKKYSIPYEREKEYSITYKEIVLPHKYFADFVVYDKIILEIKAVNGIADEFIKQTLNYLSVSKNKLGIIANFGEDSLKFQRIVL
jgi:GxxExxY protein